VRQVIGAEAEKAAMPHAVLRTVASGLLAFLALDGLVSLVVGLVTNDYSRFHGAGGLFAIALIVAVGALDVACWIALPAVAAFLVRRGWPGARILVSVLAALCLVTAIGGDVWNLIALAVSLGATVLVWLPATGLSRRASPSSEEGWVSHSPGPRSSRPR
jgi:hypothetical protein